MQLLLFSDVHRDLAAAARLVDMARDVDVVIGAGDFASVHKGLVETIEAFRGIETPTILVAGNNETPDALTAACAGWPSAHVCHGSAVTVSGVTFFGLGGGIPPTPWDWSYDLTEDDAAEALAEADAVDVLVLHSPPKGHLDSGRGLGSVALLAAIERLAPALAICGHIHECWGQESRLGPTRVVNPGPQGRVVEIDPRSSESTDQGG